MMVSGEDEEWVKIVVTVVEDVVCYCYCCFESSFPL